jgi:hypothetical protein
VLSADRFRAGAPEPAVVADVLHGLCGTVGAVVLDVDRGSVVVGESMVAACDAVLVVVPRDLAAVAGVLAMRPFLDGPSVGLVVRGPAELGAAEVGDAVDLPVLGTWRRDRGLSSARGGLPGRGRTSRLAARLAKEVL